MRSLARTAAAALLLAAAATALAGKKKGGVDRPEWGGLGYMTQGWMIGDVTGAGDTIDAAPGMGQMFGGGGVMLLGGRAVLGGQGYALFDLGGGDDQIDVEATGGGGGVHLGYAFLNADRDLMYVYAGGVGQGIDLHLANGSSPTSVGGVDLLEGERKTLIGGGWSVDVGVSMFRLFWGDDPGGMAIGASIGGWIPVSSNAWEVKGGGNTTLDGSTGGVYLRMNLGGGGAFPG